jgi:hypothetical protein
VSDIDGFAASLLEEAKRFLEKAAESDGSEAENANLHAALMLAFSALEAHVNSVADEIAVRRDIGPHELGALLEKTVRLKDGEYYLSSKLRIHRLEERIAILHRMFTGKPASGPWKSKLAAATDLRNKLTHPKDVPNISTASVKRAIEAVIETIDALYVSVYRKRFPAAHRKLESKLGF